ncbi:Gfo/Idh/MocA family oxidoreductase [Sphingobacterium faecium]|uniref:Gfo/Idh/MocA family protein n=1 Tax=Sphingobacterium faecium TaxID=34087 RepID=UPI00320B946B
MNLENLNRRSFLKKTNTMVLGTALAASSIDLYATNASKKIKIGLVGCGGRGTGAASQALRADPNVIITAVADIFQDQVDLCLDSLKQISKDQVKVDNKNIFLGFLGFQKLMDTDVDVVLLCSPPNFRPDHLEEAVKKGKHIFCEKPVAVDIPNLKRVFESVKIAKDKNLCLVSGFCFRYATPNREIFQRIKQGDIGDIQSISTFRFGGELSHKERQADWSDLEYQLRNWFYFQRYSGDLIVEQAIHSVDMMSWALGDIVPKTIIATGGRQSRERDKFGNVFDHMSIEFDYGNGLKGFHSCRQQNGTDSRNTVDVIGKNGRANLNISSNFEVYGDKPWKFTGRNNNMYQTQHDELFQAIRNKKVINDGPHLANSTLLAIWSRAAAYTGKAITYDQIMQSTEVLGPTSAEYDWKMQADNRAIPQPGKTPFI